MTNNDKWKMENDKWKMSSPETLISETPELPPKTTFRL